MEYFRYEIFDKEHRISQKELTALAKYGYISKLFILETYEGYYVVAYNLRTGDKPWYLESQRSSNKPRIFKMLEKLSKHIKEFFPVPVVHLCYNMELPPLNEKERVAILNRQKIN